MALHPVFIHFHTGILAANAALALVCLLFRLVFRDAINTPGTKMAKIFHEFDIFIFWGNIIGFLGLIAGMLTGFMDWPIEAVLASAYMRSKILFSAVALQVYMFLILVRVKIGDRIWTSTSGFLIYGILIIIGGGLMIVIAAMGGIAVYGTSILKPILDWVGMPWP